MFGFFGPKKPEVLEHWFTLVEFFQHSPNEFYALVEKGLQDRKVPGLAVARVDFAEGGILSVKREYLRLTRERLIFDICAAPFGTGFFFSSRFAELPLVINPLEVLVLFIGLGLLFGLFIKLFGFILGPLLVLTAVVFGLWFMRSAVALGLHDLDATLLKTPVISPLYERFIRKETYYRQDTRLMYLQTVPALVKQIVGEITAANGVKLLQQYEYKPILGDLYQPSQIRLGEQESVPPI